LDKSVIETDSCLSIVGLLEDEHVSQIKPHHWIKLDLNKSSYPRMFFSISHEFLTMEVIVRFK